MKLIMKKKPLTAQDVIEKLSQQEIVKLMADEYFTTKIVAVVDQSTRLQLREVFQKSKKEAKAELPDIERKSVKPKTFDKKPSGRDSRASNPSNKKPVAEGRSSKNPSSEIVEDEDEASSSKPHNTRPSPKTSAQAATGLRFDLEDGADEEESNAAEDFDPESGSSSRIQPPNTNEIGPKAPIINKSDPGLGSKRKFESSGPDDIDPDSGSKRAKVSSVSDDNETSVDSVPQKTDLERQRSQANAWKTTPYITVEWTTNLLSKHLPFALKDDEKKIKDLVTFGVRTVSSMNLDAMMPRIFKLISLRKAEEDSMPTTGKNINMDIQRNVHAFAKCKKGDELNRIRNFCCVKEMATLCSMKSKGEKSRVLDEYVHSTFQTTAEYEEAKKDTHKHKLLKKPWIKAKMTGEKVKTLTDAFGDGILLFLPENINVSTIYEWSLVKVQVLVHCLQNAPFAATFRSLCDQGTEVLKIYTTDSQADIKAVENNVAQSLRVIGQSRTVNSEFELQACIALYPRDDFGLPIGRMRSYLDRSAMESLRVDGEIQDEIIRAILGLEWGAQGESSTTFVVDPVYNDPSHNKVDIEERAVTYDKKITQVIIPLHHPSHWTMVHVDLQERIVKHFDSYLPGQEVRTRRVEEEVVPLTLHKVQGVKPGDFKVEQGVCAMQDGNDCGIHTIANGIALLQKNGQVGKEIDGVAKRLEYAARILQARFASRIRLDAIYTEEEEEEGPSDERTLE